MSVKRPTALLELPLSPTVLRRRVRNVFYGWWIVSGGFSIQLLVGSLLIHSFGAYFPLLQQQFGWNRTLLAGAFSLSRIESGLLGPVQGWLIEKFGSKTMIRVGIIMFGVGFMLFSQIDSLWSYYAVFALMAVGSSLAGFLTVATTIVNWFEKKRATAMGITMSGFGIGGLLAPLVALSLINYGWERTAFGSGVLIIVAGLALSVIIRESPERYGWLPDGAQPDSPRASGEGEDEQQPDLALYFTARQAMKTSSFWLLAAGHAAAMLTVSAVMLHLIPYAVENLEMSIPIASTAVAVMTTFNIMGQISGGFMGDRINQRLLLVVCMLGHSAALLILANVESIIGLYTFAVLHGLAWGVRGPMMTTIRADYFGRRFFPTIMGYNSLFMQLGMFSGPLVAAFLADINQGDYSPGFTLIALVTGVGSIFFAFAKRPVHPSQSAGLPPKAVAV